MIVAGFGFRAAATAESLRSALLLAAGATRIDALATPNDKAGAPCLRELAGRMSLPVVPVGDAALVAIRTPTESTRVRAERRTGSVAEASALAAAGLGARLLSRRHVSEDRLATCAIAVRRSGGMA
jgi:cobalt-precorrin 5A hydrolase